MKKLLFIPLIFTGFSLSAQNDTILKLTLKDAVNYAIEHNIIVENSKMEIRKAKWKVWETTAIGLPQVNGSVEYQYFTDIPTQLMPNFMLPVIVGVNTQYFGLHPIQQLPNTDEKIPVQFGSKHNATWGLSVSQLIFSGEYIVGLQAAKTYKLISEQNYEKAKLQIKSQVKQAYFLTLIAKESKNILTKNYENIKKIYHDTKKMYEQGMIEKNQLDQMQILELNIKNQISSLTRQERLAILMLKFQLGLTPQDSLILTDNLDEITKTLDLKILTKQFAINNNIDYQLIKTQTELKNLQLKQYEAKTLPKIAAYYSFSKKAMLDTFQFFDKNTDWFPTSVVGLKISIPIFSSGQRYSQITQKKIEFQQAINQQKNLENSLYIKYEQAKNNYINNLNNLYNQKKNLELSQNIYNQTQTKYKNGSAGSMDLTQSQNQFLQAEAQYYQAILEALNSQIKLEELLNK